MKISFASASSCDLWGCKAQNPSHNTSLEFYKILFCLVITYFVTPVTKFKTALSKRKELRLSSIKFYFVWSLPDWQLLPQNLKPSRLEKSHFT